MSASTADLAEIAVADLPLCGPGPHPELVPRPGAYTVERPSAHALGRGQPNGPAGSLTGHGPVPPGLDWRQCPVPAVPAVYFPFGPMLLPCHTGTAARLRGRLRRHSHSRPFEAWQACAWRAGDCCLAGVRLTRHYRPGLNRAGAE